MANLNYHDKNDNDNDNDNNNIILWILYFFFGSSLIMLGQVTDEHCLQSVEQ